MLWMEGQSAALGGLLSRNGWYHKGLCCHPAGPGQAGDVDREEHNDIQPEQVRGSTAGED